MNARILYLEHKRDEALRLKCPRVAAKFQREIDKITPKQYERDK